LSQNRGFTFFWIPASGLVAKQEIALSLAPKGQAPRNDERLDFSVIARPAKQAVAISRTQRVFQQQALPRE